MKRSLSPMQQYIWKADQIINLDNILTKLMIIKNLELEENGKNKWSVFKTDMSQWVTYDNFFIRKRTKTFQPFTSALDKGLTRLNVFIHVNTHKHLPASRFPSAVSKNRTKQSCTTSATNLHIIPPVLHFSKVHSIQAVEHIISSHPLMGVLSSLSIDTSHFHGLSQVNL